MKRLFPSLNHIFKYGAIITTFASSPILIKNVSKEQPHDQKQVVTESAEYIEGIKIWNTGIMEDPVPGEKRGKGVQHLSSSFWVHDLAHFIHKNFDTIKSILQYAHSKTGDRNDFIYLINQSNALFMKAENMGFRTEQAKDYFLMASFLTMAAAEVDNYSFSKYSIEERKIARQKFYDKFLKQNSVEKQEMDENLINNKYCCDEIRVDLIPYIALERLGIHNELCALKWGDNAIKWKTDGFKISKRIDSIKRHFDGVHNRDFSEDHIAHLMWGFMAVYHVLIVFPQMNDLPNFDAIRLQNECKLAIVS